MLADVCSITAGRSHFSRLHLVKGGVGGGRREWGGLELEGATGNHSYGRYGVFIRMRQFPEVSRATLNIFPPNFKSTVAGQGERGRRLPS